MQAPRIPTSAVLILAAGAALAFYVWRKGGVAHAAASIGAAAVDAVGGAASGAVGAIGASVGIPTPDETTTDARVARWLIDREGWFVASLWSGAPALFAAGSLPAGSGTPPPAGSAIAAAFPPRQLSTGDFTRTDHGYDEPAPLGSPLPGFSANDPATWGIGL